MELTVTLQERRNFARQLYVEIRRAIIEGRLRPGEKVPSSREFAERLRVSRSTINEAYELLASEGFLEMRHGSGTFVSRDGPQDTDSLDPAAAKVPLSVTAWARGLSYSRSIVPQRDLPHDFRPGLPDLHSFPIDVWRRLTARTLRTLSPALGYYADPAGIPDLRAAIARYISHSRAVHCSSEEVLVTNGAQQALDLLARVLVEPRSVVAVEDPGYPAAVSVFRAMGARVVPVPVDGEGVRIDLLPADARLVYVTPSHQFPLGVTLSLPRRKALIEWAAARGTAIVEDDYDSEFRYGGRPLESLQGLDRSGVVIYLGTFSKVLFPALRLGYMVVPPALKEPLLAAKWITDRHTPVLEQYVMAAFMGGGHFQKYVRRMERVYGERQRRLLEALESRAAPWLTLLPSVAGLHVTAFLRGGLNAEDVVARAFAMGISLYSIESFYQRMPQPGLMFGYGKCTLDDIDEGVERLRNLLMTMRPDFSAPPTLT